ncbi:SpoIVB peptidase [Thermoanaerobacter sp. X514]|jgi:stage IV sporulation protein B|uniref:SpoIVB peptidase n=1 Tax=Thermoanaerobacter sp. (strain X514) TaxID=399726 RepID=UPI0000E1E2AB|nr:SpoIVB peptidase [Thermoanaerobacter sp. X514]ABY92832.1 peptidase S55, SpoIVB [Thermoanaerobacter sp. X514]
MTKNTVKLLLFIFLSFFLVFANYFTPIQDIAKTPSSFKFFQGEKVNYNFNIPIKVSFQADKKGFLKINDTEDKNVLNLKEPITIEAVNTGTVNLDFKLFGIFPIKHISVDIVPTIKVVPGGQAIGVNLNTKGALVVGYSDIMGEDGKIYSPYKQGKIQIGDIILEVNGKEIKQAEDITNIANELQGKALKLKINRKNNIFYTTIYPIKSKEDKQYRIGLWVRDHTAGIGTLTFYYPASKMYGALGHAITDIDTGHMLSVENGEIMNSRITSIDHGRRSKPGELKGIFLEEVDTIGNILKNTEFGIYGNMYEDFKNDLYGEIPIAYQSQIKEGPAKILATIDNTGIQQFDIEIIKKVYQETPSPKSMIIKIVDKNLLKKTGGIIQGMSGSPIIQDGKLVGAVTHVFVNDPTKGYAVYAEWMINEMNTLLNNKQVFTNN